MIQGTRILEDSYTFRIFIRAVAERVMQMALLSHLVLNLILIGNKNYTEIGKAKGKTAIHMDSTENVIEFITNSHTATVTFTNRKHINKIKRLYEKNRDGFTYFVENIDGSVCAKIPLKWIKISPPKAVSDKQREAARIRFQNTMGRKK